ncbi:MAG: dehydrogenase [Actinomycetia bacterium]|nr:dehydrogenase [Actinomycetes bacterium]
MVDPGAVGATVGPERHSWTADDALLYALAVGAGPSELAFTTENSHDCPQRILPTFALVICPGGRVLHRLGDVDLGRAVHGAQVITLHGPLPTAGAIDVVERVTALHDKGPGRHAIVETTATGHDATTGALLIERVGTVVLRGQGGFGGSPAPPAPAPFRPDLEPDVVVEDATRAEQALRYRLTGDRNPLHSDPWFAVERGGFPAPILHGLCTYGFAGRALLHELCGGDPAWFGTMSARFTSPVVPGEVLRTSIWRHGEGARFRTVAGADERLVLDDGRFLRRP